jgi:hypothetical protein
MDKQDYMTRQNFEARLAMMDANYTQYDHNRSIDIDVYSRKGSLWKATGMHILPINDEPSRTSTRKVAIEKMMQGYKPCPFDLCGYCR